MNVIVKNTDIFTSQSNQSASRVMFVMLPLKLACNYLANQQNNSLFAEDKNKSIQAKIHQNQAY